MPSTRTLDSRSVIETRLSCIPPMLAPPILISDDESLPRLVQELSSHPIIAVDTESNNELTSLPELSLK